MCEGVSTWDRCVLCGKDARGERQGLWERFEGEEVLRLKGEEKRGLWEEKDLG